MIKKIRSINSFIEAMRAARHAGCLSDLSINGQMMLCDATIDDLLMVSDGGWFTEVAQLVQFDGRSEVDAFDEYAANVEDYNKNVRAPRPKIKKVGEVLDEAALAASFDKFFGAPPMRLGEGQKAEVQPGDEINNKRM